MINKTLHQPKTPILLRDVEPGLVVPVSIDSSVTLPVTIMSADYFVEVARGNIAGQFSVNKFGRSTNVDSGVTTDIWDRANATDDQDIWTPPTEARLHNVASSSANDNGIAMGTGARTVEIFGLTDWDTAELSEIITMNGITNVPTVNSYVIIHRVIVRTWGTAGPNVGTITITAVTDATITAQVNTGEGQTQMAIYGIPSTQTAYMTAFYFALLRGGGGNILMDGNIVYNPIPDEQLLGYITKHTTGKTTTGTSDGKPHEFSPPKVFEGPGIIKLQAVGSAADLDISAGFDLILIDN